MGQNVLAIDLVVEHVKAVSRLVLRLAIQLDLKVPNLTRRCQTHRQSPHLSSFTSTPEARALSSTSVTRFHRSYGPLRLPDRPSPFPATFGDATSASPEPPPLTRIAFPACCAHYPGGPDRVLIGCTVTHSRAGILPHPHGLPRFLGGSASTSSLSRPAQALHALRPARLLAHHAWALSRGSALTSFPARTPASYQVLPTTT